MNNLRLKDKKILVNNAHKNYENIVYLRKHINESFWTLVEQLKIARENKIWTSLNYESWSSFLAQPEIDLHTGTFENTSPTDGKIYLDYRQISEQELVDFLSFKLP